MNNAVLIFMGVGASGKTFTAKALTKKYPMFERVSSGDIIREHHDTLSEVDKQEDEEWISKYGLSKYNNVIKERIFNKIKKTAKTEKILLLDGYPRTVEQFIDLTNTEHRFMLVRFDVHIVVALRRME